MLVPMKLVRKLIVSWMVLWLGASGALAEAMPYCDHALGTDVATEGVIEAAANTVNPPASATASPTIVG